MVGRREQVRWSHLTGAVRDLHVTSLLDYLTSTRRTACSSRVSGKSDSTCSATLEKNCVFFQGL